MDPNATLATMREAVTEFRAAQSESIAEDPVGEAAHSMADAFEAIDGWLSNGGFAPTAWRAPSPTGAARFAPGDRVTYFDFATHTPQLHGTVLADYLTRDEPGDPQYRVYKVQLKGYTGDGGIGSPWPEAAMIRGWLVDQAEPAAPQDTARADALRLVLRKLRIGIVQAQLAQRDESERRALVMHVDFDPVAQVYCALTGATSAQIADQLIADAVRTERAQR